MKDYLLHTLSPGDFETLVVKLCHQILGIGAISFSAGPDGGRDAFFEGTAECYPSSRDPWRGKFVIQAKHTERSDASCSEKSFVRLLTETEAPKVAAHRRKGRCDNYLLFTNRKLGALTEEKLVGELRRETGVPNVAILGKETLATYLGDAPQIAESLRLQVAPFVGGLPTIAPPTRDFAGRADELEVLRRQVREHGGAVIFGVRGLGGIGKTELCRKLVDEIGGDYPDGHVLVDLRGASEKPLTAAEALAEVIRAYEPQARLPDAESDLRRLYDQVLKDRRAIVFLDDAAGAEQVEPLLPHTGCLTLVTSRRRFALPALHSLDLDALTPEAAREVLLSLASRLGVDADRIAELLGRLPLALRLAGSAFAERPGLKADKYVHKLESRDARVSLVEAAIDFNYSALDAELQPQWRALAVFPGGFDAEGAAAVWDLSVDASEDVLDGGLYAVSLVECREGRYRLHDLARDFAASRLEGEERQLGARRHASHYVEVLREANRLYMGGGERVVEGLALFDLEWGNIQAGQSWATTRAQEDHEATQSCFSYGHVGVFCLSLRLPSVALLRWLEVARFAAVVLGDEAGEIMALFNLANALTDLGEVEKAVGYYEQVLVVAREKGGRFGESAALSNLGTAYYHQGEFDKAVDYHEQALAVDREIGNRHGEGNTLSNLGLAYADLGEVDKAIGYYEQALIIHREMGNHLGESTALSNIGLANVCLGEFEKAIGYCERALVIAREIGDRRGQSSTLSHLGLAHFLLGEVEKSIDYYEQALAIAREIGFRYAESNALVKLGSGHHSQGEFAKAIGYYERALVIARKIGDRRVQSNTLTNLGSIFADLGEVEMATLLLEQALEIGQQDPRIVEEVTKQLKELRGS